MGAVVLILALKHRLSEQGYLLAQPAQGGRLPLPGAGRAHQLRLARNTSAATTSSTAATTWSRTTSTSALTKEQLLERFLPALPRFNPAFEPRLGARDLAVPDAATPSPSRS